MVFLSDINYSITFDCPYLPGEQARYRMFHADDLSASELEFYLSSGYRKFGTFFFKPHCRECWQCTPVRTLTGKIQPSKSQRRALRKADDVEIRFTPLHYTDEIFDIYCDHSRRFNEKESTREDFLATFYTPSCPALQSEYYLHGTLFAVGYLDISAKGLSSVYFIYRRDYDHLSPGTISVFYECAEARRRNLPYYYLGYYIRENSSMNYKNRFTPCEMFDWKNKQWYHVADPSELPLWKYAKK